ncbi:MAG: hypothetical protein KDK27_16635, partial [Leptospiraceae bacterium]|nr:hypothetical protein [Leptospiraceae bacterium]
IELELLRGRQKGGPVGQKEVRDLRQANEQLELKLKAEQKRAETLQAELVHVADQLIAAGHRDGIALAEAYNDLRQDYAGLEKQFQESARRNVELARMFEHVRSQHGLQPALEITRQRINTILREAGRRPPQAMMRDLQSEIQALRQVRTVLGGALFNLGLLLLHNGDRSGAIPELRAARELGVESAETNELLRSVY